MSDEYESDAPKHEGVVPYFTDAADNAEEYELWKLNSVTMYSRVNEIALEWPSLTFQWLPKTASDDVVSALVGTYSSNSDEEESLKVIAPDLGQLPEEFEKKVFTHQSEVNRARYNPHNARYVATLNAECLVSIYDLESDSKDPLFSFSGHEENGYGLAWDPHTANQLLTSADNGEIKLWGVDFESKTAKVLLELNHEDGVNDVVWAPNTPNEFAAATENGFVYVYTLDGSNVKGEPVKIEAHDDAVNSLAYSPFSKYMIATVSGDNTVGIWDIRAPEEPLHILSGHSEPVYIVKWSPHVDGILATSGRDRRVILWDIRRIGQEQNPDDAEDAAAELLFMHGGHTAPVSDFDWHPTEKWLLGSVSEDNICQIWVPSDQVVNTPKVPALPKYIA